MFEEKEKTEITVMDNGVIVIKKWTEIYKYGVRMSSSVMHRSGVNPGDSAPEGADQKVLDAIATFHTPEVIAAYQASLETPE